MLLTCADNSQIYSIPLTLHDILIYFLSVKYELRNRVNF